VSTGFGRLVAVEKDPENDRHLVCCDGCRLDKDKERPRVEHTLTRVTEVPREKGGVDAGSENMCLDV